ncbi:hypothetical protein NQ315_007369 [Exocentrus adspersus]|uniref:Uncharacterized protein n=1 Tax=Exocentrus adspersus TaxID=1586481 RepID=A0AAV8VH58_9CUCU|nr:hypothetical protein NQ315_007369 [Exocentrus adspersus]
MPEHRPRSAAPPEISHLSVYQKAHCFFAQLKMPSAAARKKPLVHNFKGVLVFLLRVTRKFFRMDVKQTLVCIIPNLSPNSQD